MPVCVSQDIERVSLALKCSQKGTSEATTVLYLKESQMLSPEGRCLLEPPDFLRPSVTSTTSTGLWRRLVVKGERDVENGARERWC